MCSPDGRVLHGRRLADPGLNMGRRKLTPAEQRTVARLWRRGAKLYPEAVASLNVGPEWANGPLWNYTPTWQLWLELRVQQQGAERAWLMLVGRLHDRLMTVREAHAARLRRTLGALNEGKWS
jgi:hypothetical protein